MSRCSYNPVADFTSSTNLAEPHEIIYFDNNSSGATNYFWDFGDGYTSTDFSPQHSYSEEGTYTITLTAKYHENASDVAHLNVDIYYTSLEVTVAEWNPNLSLDNLILNANVTLYATYDDWYNYRYPIDTRITNSTGVAVFPHVEPTVYYIDIDHPYYNNNTLGQEDISYIETLSLDKSMINSFTAWVDHIKSSSQQQNKVRIPYIINGGKRAFKRVDVTK